MTLPPPRFDCTPMLPRIPSPMNPLFDSPGPMRQNLPPRPQISIPQLNGPSQFFARPRAYGTRPITMSPMGRYDVRIPRPPIMRHYHRRIQPPQMIPPMRLRFMTDNGNIKDKVMTNMNKLEAYPQQDNKGPHNQEDKNDDSEDNTSYYCGVCDRDFSSENALTEHKSTHKLCGIDGCTFSAHPLLVEKHISMQHSTGLYARMKDLSEEEGVKKWTEERKKRFPTKNNIKLRQVENLEKLQRGETIKQDRHVFKTTKVMNMRGKKRKLYKWSERKNNDYLHTGELYRGLHPFPGINIYLQEENSSEVYLDEETEQIDLHKEMIDDISDEDVDTPHILVESKSTNLSTLPSLVANYESETESEKEDDFPEEVPIRRIKMEDLQNHKIVENVTVFKETSNNAQSCTDARKDKSNCQIITNEIHRYPVNKHQNKQKHQTKQTVEHKKHEKMATRHRSSLLQMLLARSIQHERNLISQCLKYIVENNFFDHPDLESNNY